MSKKSRKATKQRHKHRPGELEVFRQNLQPRGLSDDRGVILLEGVEEKMSGVLLEFIEPYMEFASTREALGRLLAVATVAWNATLMSEERRRELIKDLLTSLFQPGGVETVIDFIVIVQQLMERKERFVRDDRRSILDFRIADTEDTWHVTVISTLPVE